MLTDEIKETLAGYAEGMHKLVSVVLNLGDHEKRQELVEFIVSVAEVSESIEFVEKTLDGTVRSPITFTIETNGEPTGIYFSGIPSGHEFNSFILAILQSGGVEIKLEDHIKQIVTNITQKLDFEIFVSLSCHNCPEIVQTINQFALLNGGITSEMIDGGLFQKDVEEKGIQGVPSVFLNGELFAAGRVDVSTLINKLIKLNIANNEQQKNEILTQDIVIIGGGPAGISAAIYAARKGFSVTVVTNNIGGQLKDTLGIENFISIAKTTGLELTSALKNHMKEYDIRIKEHVNVVKLQDGFLKKVVISSGEIIQTRAIIIATGANWKRLGIPGEAENIGNGVAYCPHCDGPFYKGKDVAVIGGGNSGVEAAIDLSSLVNTVTLVEFLPELKADQILTDQLDSRDNISVVLNAETKMILSKNGKVIGLEYEKRDTYSKKILDVSGIFVQIGLVPNTGIFKEVLDLNEFGEIIVDEFCKTSIEGIYACGDVTTIPYKQIIMAMGEGSKAAITASDYLQKNPLNLEMTTL